MSELGERVITAVDGLRQTFGVEEPPEQIAAIRLFPTRVEFDIYRLNENGDKYVDLETDEVPMETRTFEVVA